jgi:hypothetical protein
MIVTPIPPGPVANQFTVVLSGPKRVVDQMRTEEPLTVKVPIPDVRPNGARTIDVKKELSAYPEQFRGLVIESVSPPEIQILIDHLTTVTMPVHVDRGDLEYEVPPAVEPPEVQVTISELAFEALEEDQRRVVLNVGELLRDQPRGQPLSIEGAPLPRRVGSADVRLTPDNVIVFGRLRAQSKIATIPAVPILVAASPDTFNRFRVQTRDGTMLITRAITVRGPVAAVDRLVANGTRGLVVLTGDLVAQPGRVIELEPVFDLPREVRLEGPVEPVPFELVPIPEASAP